jgi:hypothetical protein
MPGDIKFANRKTAFFAIRQRGVGIFQAGHSHLSPAHFSPAKRLEERARSAAKVQHRSRSQVADDGIRHRVLRVDGGVFDEFVVLRIVRFLMAFLPWL